MGALTSNRKRVSDFSSCYSPLPLSPSELVNLTHYSCYSNHVDLNLSKKRRVSFPVEKQQVLSTVSRFQKYPEPVGKLRREVHAPCRSTRIPFLSSLSNRGLRFRPIVTPEKEEHIMGNVFGSNGSLWRRYEDKKQAAIGALRHLKVNDEEKEEVVSEDSSDLVIIEDGNEEVRSVVSDKRKGFETNGLGFVIESRYLDSAGLENSVGVDDNVVHSTMLDREAYKKLLNSVDKKYSPKIRTLEFEIKSNETKLQSMRSSQSLRRQQAKKLEELKNPGEDLLQELFVPLSEEEEGQVKQALLNTNRRKVLVTHENSNIQITGETLQCLRPGAWLNDEVINVYLELLKEREIREPKKYLSCHFFNTFFYKKLTGGRTGYEYKSVKRWTSLRKLGYKLSECDKIFVPIHKEVHWCLAVINNKDRTFQYLDSLGGRDSQVLNVLAKYYVDEVKDKCGQDVDVSSWELEYVEDLTEQQNGYDCGVFMIKYADFYSRGMGLHFSQENMPYFRRRIAKEILKLQAH